VTKAELPAPQPCRACSLSLTACAWFCERRDRPCCGNCSHPADTAPSSSGEAHATVEDS
jgi:hypothetical protein